MIAYKFYLDTKEVIPHFGNGQGFSEKRQAGRKYKLRELGEDLKFDSLSFKYIEDQDVEHIFDFVVEKDGVEQFVGTFTKTDCNFNRDESHVSVSVTPTDKYKSIIDGMQTVVNIKDLNPSARTITYDKFPMLQVYLLGSGVVTNVVNGKSWEVNLSKTNYTHEALIANGFGTSDDLLDTSSYVIGVGETLVSGGGGSLAGEYGSYDSAINGYSNGTYMVRNIPVGADRQIVISDLGNTVGYYESLVFPLSESPLFHPVRRGRVLEDTVSLGTQTYFYTGKVYARLLTDKLASIDGVTSEDFEPSEDILGNDAPSYKYFVPVVADVTISEDNETTDQGYGQFAPNSLFHPNKYFAKPVSALPIFSLYSKGWTECSWWVRIPNELNTVMTTYFQTNYINDCFALSEVIQLFLNRIDSTINYTATVNHSKFFHASSNPVSGLENTELFITQKTNVLVINADEPASKAETSLRDLFEMLLMVFKVDYFVDGDDLVIEHVSFFENGGTYVGQEIGVDLQAIQDLKTGRNWAFGQDEYSYIKEQIPEQIDFAWMDDSNYFFDGYPIVMKSTYAQKGNIQQNKVNGFSTNIEEGIANPAQFSKDGFFLMSATPVQGDIYQIAEEAIPAIGGGTATFANGDLSFMLLHQKYHRHGLPTRLVNINGSDTTALSVNRTKKQVVRFRNYDEIDNMKLITTNLGTGEIESLERNFASDTIEIEVRHEP